MADYDSTSEAQRLLRVIDQRIESRTGDQIERTWGIVATVSDPEKEADVYLYGQSTASSGFRLTNGLKPNAGERVRVAIDRAKDDRWVEEVIASSAYQKLAFDHGSGYIDFGPGTDAPDVRLYRGGANLLQLGDADSLKLYGAFTGPTIVVQGGGGNPSVGVRWDADTADRTQIHPDGFRLGSGSASPDWLLERTGASAASVGVNDMLDFKGSTSAGTAHRSWVSGEAQPRFYREYGGKTWWGDGTNAPDANLYRSASDTLKTDDAFQAASLAIGANKVMRYVHLTPVITVFNFSTTTSSITRTSVAEMTGLPTDAAYVNVKIVAASTSVGTAGRFQVYDYNDSNVRAECFPGAVANQYNAANAPMVKLGGTNNRQIDYSVTIPAAGTTTYAMHIQGYWTEN